jgi:hypothetical protein
MFGFLQQMTGVFLCVLLMFTEVACLRDSYSIKLSGPVTIGNEWVEFAPKQLLKADKDLQWVLLDLAPPFEDNSRAGPGPGAEGGIRMPDGEVINPEIEVIDQYGNSFKLNWGGTRHGWPAYDLPYPQKLPRDREYKTVRIRSPRPIKFKAIYWFCDSVKDWK